MPEDAHLPREKTHEQALFHPRPMLLGALGLLCGVIAGAHLGVNMAWIVACAGALLVMPLMRMGRRVPALMLACLALGMCRTLLSRPPTAPTGEGMLSGTVAAAPDDYGKTARVLLKDVSFNGAPVEARVFLNARFQRLPACGDRVSAYASLSPPAAEKRMYAGYRGVSAYAYASKTPAIKSGDGGGFVGALVRVRSVIAARIDALFPDADGVANGMLLGDTGDVSAYETDAFRRAGVSHLFAVSGLHVSILAGAFSMLFRRNAIVRFVASAIFLLGYALLTACSPSVLRAAVMLLAYQSAPVFGRMRDSISSLAFAFIVVLLYNPYALFHAGFQLSFCAVYGLILLSEPIGARLRRIGSFGAGLVASSAAVVVATLPAACACFGEAQLLSLATNLFVLPVAPVFLVPAFLGTAVSFVCYPLGSAICAPARLALDCIRMVAASAGELSLAIPAPSPVSYALYMLSILLFSRLLLLKAGVRRQLALMSMLLAVALWRV